MSGACDFAQLGNSLEVIQEYAQNPLQFCLVPDPRPNGIRIEKSSSFWGHCWKILKDMPPVSSFFYGTLEQTEEAQLTTVFKNIRNEFEKALQDMQAASQQYRKALHNASWKGSGPVKLERTVILSIADSLHLFFSGQWKDCLVDIELLQKQFSVRICTPLVQLSEMKTITRFAHDYAMVAVEGILFRSFPMRAFAAIIDERPLDAVERDEVNDWNKSLLEKKERLTPGLLHMALYGVVEILLKDETLNSKEFSKRFFTFEWNLYKRYKRSGFQLFDEGDLHHISWLRSLEVGKTMVQVNGKECLLGNPVSCLAFAEEKVAVYELQNEPEKLVMMSLVNQAQLGLWQGACEDISWALRSIQCEEVDSYGHYCIIENVQHCLEDVVWRTRAGAVDGNDVPMLQPLVTFFSAMKQQTVPPASLQLKNLFLAKKGDEWTLRAFPLMEQLPSSPEYRRYQFVSKLEDFAKVCAKKNRIIFRYLTHESGLVDHPLPVFYRAQMVSRLLGTARLTEEEAVAHEGIQDAIIVDQLKAFMVEFPKARDVLYSKLQPKLKYPKEDDDRLKRAIANDLAGFQRDEGYCTTPHPRLLEQNYINAVERHIQSVDEYRDLFV